MNISTRKYYIGSTINYKERKRVHFKDLKENRHHNIYLQRSFNKHGINSFKFIVIETCLFNFRKREQEILNNIDFKYIYNVSKSSSGGDLIYNHPDREDIIKRVTEQLMLAPRPEPKFGSDNPNWRGGISKSNCIYCSIEINGSAKSCSDCYFKNRDISGINNPFFNKTHSVETKRKIGNANKGRINKGQCKPVIVDSIEYESLSLGARSIGISPSLLLFRIRSKNKRFNGYLYK